MVVDGTKLTPDEGKMLYNGQVYSNMVFLGRLDSVENWQEVPYSEYEDYLKAQEEEMKREMESRNMEARMNKPQGIAD